MVELENLYKVYEKNGQEVFALRGVSLIVGQGEFVSVIGPSGSGKTTLMNIVGCLDTPSSGRYLLQGKPVTRLGGKSMARTRNREIGFIFQHFNLIPTMSALENVELPLVFRGESPARRREIASLALQKVGLSQRQQHHPRELSGGQQQRVAIARTLACQPQLILADEPTGNLDVPSGEEVMEMLEAINAEGKTILLITHDLSVAARAQRIIRMEDGRITALA